MAVVGMVGVSFVGPAEEIERVAFHLLETENFEPMSPEVMMGGHPMPGRVQTFRGNRYDALLDRLETLWIRAGEPLPRKRVLPQKQISPQIQTVPRTQPEKEDPEPLFSVLEAKVGRIVDAMATWKAELEAIENEREVWRAALEFGDAVRETGRNISSLADVPYGRFAMGSLTRDNWRRLQETSPASPFLAMPLIEEEGRVTAVVFYGVDFHGDMEKIFSSVHMRVIPFRPEDALQYDNPDAVRYHIEDLEAEAKNRREMPARYISENRPALERLYAVVYAKQRIYALAQKRGELPDVMVLSGWLPRDSYDAVLRMTTQEVPRTLIMAEQGDALEEAGNELPTLLSNLPLIRRFQEIVRLYSLPSYSELDPTFVVALSFCLFFGFMFGDVGHGILLALGTWFMEKKGMMGHSIASVLRLAGGSSIFFGFLYGSVFGSEELIEPIWLSPMKDVNTLLPISIGVGIFFLTLGICFRIQNAAHRGEWGEVLFGPEGFSGLLFYWLAVAWIAAGAEMPFGAGVFAAVMTLLFLVMIFGNGLAKYFFQGDGIDEGGVVHVFSIFHAMLNFVSNTASFVRLAAFALNHVGLSGAVFMLAQMVEDVPGGRIGHALVLLFGQLLIVGLEGLIVFIQTLRLEYYEFFGKFYRGGGREFLPVLWQKDRSGVRSEVR
ncbi:MAG: ATPase [Synergistaceae bacterium]|jgi:V/A-type H+-transporting ATPase subunit I|nr:ATPase [Synergistaceae bacterium]